MPANFRQKACTACADSKRRCDKKFPECQRCLDRDMDCIYPQPKRRRRAPIARDTQTEELPAFESHAEAELDFGDWNVMGAADLDLSILDAMIPYSPTASASVAGPPAQGAVVERGSISSTPLPWFLRDETWVLQHSKEEPACVTSVELEPFIWAVEEMLQSWVRNGHNSFIHRRLYENGMPTCVQDAFTTLAAYTNRTSAVKETILQIAQERSFALCRQDLPPADGAQSILAHLARVQALFVYEFIQLFDGSVRLRASAEQQLPTLRQWTIELWEAVKRYRGEDGFFGQHPLRRTVNEFEREYDTSSGIWKLWILTESVRRTQVIIDTIANVYQIMTRGWADCTGAVMFTARYGLWEAESAVKWLELSCAKPPLLVPSLQPGPLISQYAAEEFDDFVKMFWTFIVGPDKIQCWIDRSSKTNRA
ncbi:MAG: hypothetical protein MMC23_005433 [Stictis urceolatum]|nr:hypothetical protein [Stictis urceolata]